MAKVKVAAPEGYHFMVNTSNAFYIMKNPISGYKEHTESMYVSQLFIMMEVRNSHTTTQPQQTTEQTTGQSSASMSTQPTTAPTPPTTPTTTNQGGY